MEPMMKEFVRKLDEDARIEQQGREQEIIEAQRLEEKRWEQLRLADRQTQAREAAEQNERELKAAERREKEREAAEHREHEREAVKARVQTVLQILEEEESRKQLLEERKKKAQEEGAAEDHRMGLGSSKRRQTEPIGDREFMVDSEDEEVEEVEEESRHYLVRQRKKNTREVAVKAGRSELGQKDRRQTEPFNKHREPVVEMESTEEEEEDRYEPVRVQKKAREGVFEEVRRTELGRKDRRQTEPAIKNRKPAEEEEEEEEESQQRPVKGRKKKQEVAAKESRRVSKSRKHESEEEEETEEESDSESSEEDLITKAAMAGVAAKLERKTKKKNDLQSQMGRPQAHSSDFPWAQPQAMSPHPPGFGYLPWLSHPPQQFGGPPAGPNDWKLRNSKVSFSNDNNNYSTNYQSNNTSHSNQENVGNNYSVTNTKSTVVLPFHITSHCSFALDDS
jgi:hypothetical protein